LLSLVQERFKPQDFALQLLLSPLTFLNYTRMMKYEASGKNAASEINVIYLGNIKYGRNYQKAPLSWKNLKLIHVRKTGALGLAVEGEELGSNLLRAGPRPANAPPLGRLGCRPRYASGRPLPADRLEI
jgi:hypothetical protein